MPARALGVVLLVFALVSAGLASPDEGQQIVLDGQALSGLHFVRANGTEYFPLQRMAEAAGLAVSVSTDGTVTAGRESFKADARVVDGHVLVSRADVKRALKATVYVDGARAVITTAGGRTQLAKRPGTEVRPRPVAHTSPVHPPRPSAGPSPAAGTPSGPGAGPGADTRAPHDGSLGVESIELDRSVAHNNMMRVRATVRNNGRDALKSVTLSFVLWEQGAPEAIDPVTGISVGQGRLYSEYPQPLGDLAPGQSRSYEVITTVANPSKMDYAAKIVELDVSSAVDSFARRRLRYGFKAIVGR